MSETDEVASRTVSMASLPTPPPPLQDEEQPLVGTGVNVGEESLNASMKPALRRLCETEKNPADRARAMELLTALELADAIGAEAAGGAARVATASSDGWRRQDSRQSSFRRPRTAAARVESQPPDVGQLTYVDSYETTHNYFYTTPRHSASQALRPGSSQMQRVVPPPEQLAPGNSFSDLHMQTTYNREFFTKPDGRCRLERSASARGVRNNNPHPHQDFLVWRYRRPATATDRIEAEAAARESTLKEPTPAVEDAAEEELTNDSFDRAVRGKCRSTYKTDFIGLQANSMPPAALMITKAPTYDKSTMSRTAFAKPPPVPQAMSTPTTRFSRKQFAPRGILPSGGVSRHRFGTRARTTYELHIAEPANHIMRVGDLRQLSNAHNAQTVARMLEDSSGEEKAAMLKLYKEMESRQMPVSIPMPAERRVLRERVGGHMRVHAKPAYMSTWTGP